MNSSLAKDLKRRKTQTTRQAAAPKPPPVDVKIDVSALAGALQDLRDLQIVQQQQTERLMELQVRINKTLAELASREVTVEVAAPSVEVQTSASRPASMSVEFVRDSKGNLESAEIAVREHVTH